MRGNFLIILIFVLCAGIISCNSYKVNGTPEAISDPMKWTVKYIPDIAEGAEDSTVLQIMNDSILGTLDIFKINLLAPDGTVLKDEGDDTYLSDLFTFQVKLGADFSENYHTWTNVQMFNPLCPGDWAEAEGQRVWLCKEGYSPQEFQFPSLFVKVNYKRLSADAYKHMEELEKNDKLKIAGNFYLEICSNDPSNDTSATCAGHTSFKIQLYREPKAPPKPIIKWHYRGAYDEKINPDSKSFRVIKDTVRMDASETCVSNPDYDSTKPDSKECLTDDRYRLLFKWEMSSSPTEYDQQTWLRLSNYSSGIAGQWYEWTNDVNPTEAQFKAHKIPNLNPLDPKNLVVPYKVRLQVLTLDRSTSLQSEPVEYTFVPDIFPSARVAAQITWKQGNATKVTGKGIDVDVDIHLIKHHSTYSTNPGGKGGNGMMCTISGPESWHPNATTYHDDCFFGDGGPGKTKSGETILSNDWNGEFVLDNVTGGGDYSVPETVNLGPIEIRESKDQPMKDPVDNDDYLVVVAYVGCNDLEKSKTGIDRCAKDYSGTDGAYTIDAKIDVIIDGVYAPRAADGDRPADAIRETPFKMSLEDWYVVAKVTWNKAWTSKYPEWEGDGVVEDFSVFSKDYNVCNFSNSRCGVKDTGQIPIWDKSAYETWVGTPCFSYKGG